MTPEPPPRPPGVPGRGVGGAEGQKHPYRSNPDDIHPALIGAGVAVQHVVFLADRAVRSRDAPTSPSCRNTCSGARTST